jgi:hypothetical protein
LKQFDIEDYLDENGLNNLYDQFKNVVVCETNPSLKNSLGNMIGRVLLTIDSKKKSLKKESRVEFSPERIKWRSAMKDNKCIVVILSHWAKPYLRDIKLKVLVKVLRSKVDSNGKRVYYEDTEDLDLTMDQFIQRRMNEELAMYRYKYVQAYENFNRRNFQLKDYYRALNETSKHYMIPHEKLKTLISNINHLKKALKKEWNNYLIQHYERHVEDKMINEFFTNDSDKSNVINMTKRV